MTNEELKEFIGDREWRDLSLKERLEITTKIVEKKLENISKTGKSITKVISTTEDIELLMDLAYSSYMGDAKIARALLKNPEIDVAIAQVVCASRYLPKSLYKEFKSYHYKRIISYRLYENFINPNITPEERAEIDEDGIERSY